jgi:hypothetical protein
VCQWRNGLEQPRWRLVRGWDELDVRRQKLELVAFQSAVEQVDRFAVAQQPQRVDQADRAEEVAGVGDAVESGVVRGRRAA